MKVFVFKIKTCIGTKISVNKNKNNTEKSISKYKKVFSVLLLNHLIVIVIETPL